MPLHMPDTHAFVMDPSYVAYLRPHTPHARTVCSWLLSARCVQLAALNQPRAYHFAFACQCMRKEPYLGALQAQPVHTGRP